jgi:hypothetical protein
MVAAATRRKLALGLVAFALVGGAVQVAGGRSPDSPGVAFYAVFALWGGSWYAWLAGLSPETRARATPYFEAAGSLLSVLAGLILLVAAVTVFEPGVIALAVGLLGLAAAIVGGYRTYETLTDA